MWPAWYREPPYYGIEGTVYVEPARLAGIIEREGRRGQAWRHHNQWTTYRPDSKRMFKSLARLHVADEQDFWNIMASCESAKIKPPTSHVDCFRGMAKLSMMPPLSPVKLFRRASFGGWQDIFEEKLVRQPVYKYDLNAAYRWAACQGLPDLHFAKWLNVYLEDEPAIYDCRLSKGAIPYWPVNRERGFASTEELRRFRVIPCEIFGGIGFRDLRVDLSAIFRAIDSAFPFCRKRISRAFWGLWNANTGPEQVSWRDGEKIHTLGNPFYNPAWCLYITSRVKMRIADILDTVLHCQVDAVLTRDRLPTGTEPGTWRLEGEYPEYMGAWIGPKGGQA